MNEPLHRLVASERLSDGRQIAAAAIGTLERYTPTDVAREDYLSSYEGDRFAESVRYVGPYPTELAVLRDLLPTIQTPGRIIAARVIDAGHFTWEDAADKYAALVTDWWTGGYATAVS